MSAATSAATFGQSWLVANTLAFLLGYLLYTPIAHGVTGPHGRWPSATQQLAHTIALAVVGALVLGAQRHVLQRYVAVTPRRVALGVVAFIVAFFAGYYQPIEIGPDTDMVFGFAVLGIAAWVGLVPLAGHRTAAAIAMVAFPVAGVIAEVLLIVVVSTTGFTPDVQGSMLQHSVFWLTLGVGTGLLGGWAGGRALAAMLSPFDARHVGVEGE